MKLRASALLYDELDGAKLAAAVGKSSCGSMGRGSGGFLNCF
ncbi:MAG: hypothetical protein JWQ54_3855 [Mucilaginibacter sp.]|nr:hypothetical protein [Mucilaginibacter sp.]